MPSEPLLSEVDSSELSVKLLLTSSAASFTTGWLTAAGEPELLQFKLSLASCSVAVGVSIGAVIGGFVGGLGGLVPQLRHKQEEKKQGQNITDSKDHQTKGEGETDSAAKEKTAENITQTEEDEDHHKKTDQTTTD